MDSETIGRLIGDSVIRSIVKNIDDVMSTSDIIDTDEIKSVLTEVVIDLVRHDEEIRTAIKATLIREIGRS